MNNNFKLNNGLLIPNIGFGVWQNTNKEECINSVYNAIKYGFRLIDTAAAYQNEEYVGIAIKRAIDEKIVERKDLFITTKLWINQFTDSYNAVKIALKKLNLNYVDLMLLHQPFGDTFSAWRGLEKAYEEKLVRSIGVSNFYDYTYQNFWHFQKIKPMVNQIEVNPFYQREKEVNYFNSKDTLVQAWSPLATGKNNIFENEILLKIAKKHNTSVPVIISKWLIDRNIIPLVKSTNIEHIKEYVSVNNIKLDSNDLQEIKKLDENKSVYFSHNDLSLIEQLCGYKI